MKNFIIFVAGVTVGSVATWILLKDRYEKLAQEDFEKRRSLEKDKNIKKEPENNIEEDITTEEMDTYKQILTEENYINYTNIIKQEVKEPVDRPYVISPDEFGEYGEFGEYETISLTYYADDVLADDNDNLIEDINEIVGLDSLTHFGEYEDDSVFVRNDRLKADYEILLDHRNYSDILQEKPWLNTPNIRG